MPALGARRLAKREFNRPAVYGGMRRACVSPDLKARNLLVYSLDLEDVLCKNQPE
jgi:hypothetical protein